MTTNENSILVPELNKGDRLKKCLCTLIGKMVKPKEERIELTEVIQQMTPLLPGAERKF